MVQKWPRFQILDPFSDKEIHDDRETEGSKNRNKKTSSHLMLKNLLVFHYYQSKAMVASSSTAAVTIAGGLISSRSVIARSRPAPVMIQQQRPSARNVKTISWISSPSKSLRVVNAGAAATSSGGVPLPPLDLTEENIELVLAEARVELAQLFDTSVGITGQVELSELDGPFVKISLKGRFWHKRSTVLARVGNYLKQRIPEILEVDIEDEKQLDDSPENF